MEHGEKRVLDKDNNKSAKNADEIKAYKVRWFILAIYFYYSSINAIQWIEYASIPLHVVKYYNISTLAVDWTAISFMALYPVFFVPASYIIDKYGLRVAGLVGCLSSAFSVAVKLLSIERDRFWVVMVGQCIAAASQAIILCLPPKVAAVWFKANEVSTACAIGCIAQMFGNAAGFLIPPMVVRDHENPDDIGKDLYVLSWGMVIYSAPVALANVIYFPKEPKQPPSIAQAEVRRHETEAGENLFYETFKSLVTDKGFLLHSLAAGISIGVFSGVATLLSQLILIYFPGENEFSGRVGFSMTMIGVVSSLLVGVLMDRTRKYKEINVGLYIISFAGVVMLTFSLSMNSKLLVFASCIVIGFASSAYFSPAFELAVELTFPNEEGTTTTILLTVTQITGSINTAAMGYLNRLIGPFWSLATQAAFLLLGIGVSISVPNRLRRQEAQLRGTGQYEAVLQKGGGA